MVSSIVPSPAPKCPPVLLTECRRNSLNSSASSTSWPSSNNLRSFGDSISFRYLNSGSLVGNSLKIFIKFFYQTSSLYSCSDNVHQG